MAGSPYRGELDEILRPQAGVVKTIFRILDPSKAVG
jgi:hypothetical protein